MKTTVADADRSHSRRKYLIDPNFQWKQAGAIALSVFLLSTTISVVLYGVLHQQARQLATNPTGYRPDTTLVMVCFGLGFAALTAGGVGLWSILMTHRICGPIFVMKRYLTQMAEGRLPAMRPLRRRDEFKDLHDALDQAIHSLRVAKQRELARINAALDAAHLALGGDGESARAALENVISRLDWLKDHANKSLFESEEPKEQVSPLPAARSAPKVATS